VTRSRSRRPHSSTDTPTAAQQYNSTMYLQFHLLLFTSISITFRTFHPPNGPIVSTSIVSLLPPTASTQFAHLNAIPVPYFLIRASFHCPVLPTSRSLIAILLFISGNIHLNPGPANHHVSLHTLNIHSLFHIDRSAYIHDTVDTNNPDIFAFTESWHNPSSTTPAQLSDITPSGYQLFSIPRSLPTANHNHKPATGGGVAFLCRDLLSPTQFQLPQYQSFESISIHLSNLPRQLTILNIYRPPDSSPYSKPFSTFLQEFTSLLTLVNTYSYFAITGDFNIHCNNTSDPQTAQFLSLLSDFNLEQHVTFPTHTQGNTLDLLITPASNSPASISCLPATPSDHYALLTLFDTPPPPAHPTITRSFRRINSINIQLFLSDLSASELITSPPDALVDLVNCFNSTLSSILDKHAPLITKTLRSSKSNPWFTPALKSLKKIRRNLERHWKSMPSPANLVALRSASNCYHNAILIAKKL